MGGRRIYQPLSLSFLLPFFFPFGISFFFFFFPSEGVWQNSRNAANASLFFFFLSYITCE